MSKNDRAAPGLHEGTMAQELHFMQLKKRPNDGPCIGGIGHYLEVRRQKMNIKAIVHEAEEGGFWAEVPAIPGCAMQGDTLVELLANLREAIQGCLSVDIAAVTTSDNQRIFEIAV